MNEEVSLPPDTNFIITKKIPIFGKARMGWPSFYDKDSPLEIGIYGFTVGINDPKNVEENGYLVRLQDSGAYYLPRESFEVINEEILFFHVYKMYGLYRIKNIKSRELLTDENGLILEFETKELAEKHILKDFEVFRHVK